ncbi:MAG: helix-turn-helix domain-containing protein, partial [Erysipelotrichaceae bacterium]
MEKYLIVDKKILPDVYDKVVEARMLLQKGEVKQISQAVKQVGISRGTFYKYKDYVFAPSQNYMGRKAVISLTLEHRKG